LPTSIWSRTDIFINLFIHQECEKSRDNERIDFMPVTRLQFKSVYEELKYAQLRIDAVAITLRG